MAQAVMFLLALGSAVAAALVVAWLARRAWNTSRATELELRLSDLDTAVSSLRDKNVALERSLALEQQRASRIAEAEAALTAAEREIDALRDGKAAVESTLAETAARLGEKAAANDGLHKDLNGVNATLEALRVAHAELGRSHAALEEELEQRSRQAEENVKLLSDAKERMTQEFKLLANDLMRQHGETFAKQNKEQVDAVLTPLKEKLVEFQQGLLTTTSESAKERAQLGEQLRTLTETSAKMTAETSNLTRALKGEAQTRGAWGEMILSTVLERSGLRKGDEYVAQESHSTDEGGRLRPDVVVNLPNGGKIIVDSKLSLNAFEAYVSAEPGTERTEALTRHVSSMRSHIKELSGKEYQKIVNGGLDYVIMFVPIEGALAAALQEDATLTAFAADLNVAIATPTTLMIALKTVANVWHVERRNRNAEAIAERAGKLYDKFVGFVRDLEEVGSRLNHAQESYEGAMGKLKTGKGNILKQVEQLKEMGAKTGKSLPAEALEGDAPEASPRPVASAES